MVEPGLEFAAAGFPRRALRRSEGRARQHLRNTRSRRVEEEADDQRPHRRQHLPADRHAPRRVRGAGYAKPQWRLHLRRGAAQVGGLGYRARARTSAISYAIFEATHGTAPKYADKDVINPGSVILSGVMMFDFMGWNEAARLIEGSMEHTILQKKVTYDFERMMEGATKVKTSEFATHMIQNMEPIAELAAE